MGRRADTLVDPVNDQPAGLAPADVTAAKSQILLTDVAENQGEKSLVPAFMLGTVIGALAGTLVGTLISPHTRAYLVGLYQLVSRRLSSAERDKLRFELLLQ